MPEIVQARPSLGAVKIFLLLSPVYVGIVISPVILQIQLITQDRESQCVREFGVSF
ncbi:asl1402 [Nostoc sp. PCC 7120 = FACHB-418]|nr:asl1402 [Nostoc sp. PCC 7120 = FACHB-418]